MLQYNKNSGDEYLFRQARGLEPEESQIYALVSIPRKTNIHMATKNTRGLKKKHIQLFLDYTQVSQTITKYTSQVKQNTYTNNYVLLEA
jgi:hypothetical protein